MKMFGNEALRTNLRHIYFENRRSYHELCRKLEGQYWYNQKQNLNNIRTKDQKAFWNRLNIKRKAKSHNFSKSELYDDFKKLVNTEDQDENVILSDHEQTNENLAVDIDNIPNDGFNLEEIKAMINKLKVGKAAGIEGAIAELLKNLDDHTLNIITKVVDKIFD